MSRIYDLLRKTGGAAANIALPLIDRAQAAGTASSSSQPFVRGNPILAEPGLALGNVRPAELQPEVELPFMGMESTQQQAAEQYRIIRTKVAMHPSRPRVLAVSSPGPADGKTMTALHLAIALALKNEVEVVLVDADLHRRQCSRLLRDTGGPGLTEVLAGEASLEQALVRVRPYTNLFLLPAGAQRPNASELLSSPRRANVFDVFRERFRFTLLDVPPVGAVADYDILEDLADAVVLVLRPDHTKRDLWNSAKTIVDRGKLAGVILNDIRPWWLWKPETYYAAETPASAAQAS